MNCKIGPLNILVKHNILVYCILQKPSGVSVMDYFSNSLYHPDSQFVPARPRIYPSKEWLRIDVVAEKDEGEYEVISLVMSHQVRMASNLEKSGS